MSEMVDRCVKAGIAGETDFAQWHPDAQAELVRTIIEAMREPTEAMADIGETILGMLLVAARMVGRIEDVREQDQNDKLNVIIYRAMIDAALK